MSEVVVWVINHWFELTVVTLLVLILWQTISNNLKMGFLARMANEDRNLWAEHIIERLDRE
jgi:hypothetical protein